MLTPIPSQNGKLELQVENVASGVDYLILVHATDPLAVNLIYEIEVDFAQDGRRLKTLVNDSLDNSQPTYEFQYHVEQSGQFHFVVSASDWSDPNESGLQMRVVDSMGQTRSLTPIRDGSSIWLDFFLNQGDYFFEFSSTGRSSSASVLFQLDAESQSSPIGPQLRDTTREPVDTAKASALLPLVNHWVPGLTVVSGDSPVVPSRSTPRFAIELRSSKISRIVESFEESRFDSRSQKVEDDPDSLDSRVLPLEFLPHKRPQKDSGRMQPPSSRRSGKQSVSSNEIEQQQMRDAATEQPTADPERTRSPSAEAIGRDDSIINTQARDIASESSADAFFQFFDDDEHPMRRSPLLTAAALVFGSITVMASQRRTTSFPSTGGQFRLERIQ